jgi:signal transduction histidine kinase
LGLPLTKALVEANHASLTIKSKEQEGTLVEVVFPPARILAE